MKLLAIVAVLTLAVPAYAQEQIGSFVYTSRRDALTDRDESLITTNEQEPRLLRTASLNWRCAGTDAIELIVSAGQFLNSQSPVSVEWRFDHEPASSRHSWDVSSTGVAAFAPVEDMLVFTDAARAATTVLVRVRDFRGVEHDLRFQLNGLTAALTRLPCQGAVERARSLETLEADLSESPTTTPFTVAPSILNRDEIVQAMIREYPAPLRDAGIGGTVRVYFFIDENGLVQDTRINQSSGHQVLDDAALALADVYRFSAALNEEERVPVWVSFPITFSVR